MAKGKASEWLDDDKLLLLQGWARDGLSDEQIAENMGISVRTLYRWKNEYWQICHALKRVRMQPTEKLRMLCLREQKVMIMRKYEKKPKTEKL